jgi:hypothetical protein
LLAWSFTSGRLACGLLCSDHDGYPSG